MQPHPGAPQAGERWNVNMPAVIGVVFVFLVCVIVWVIATSGGDDDVADAPAAGEDTPATATTRPPAAAAGSSTLATTPTPLPVTVPTSVAPGSSVVSSTPTSAPATVPVTAAPGAGDDATPGDLAIAGHPMQQPGCNGSYITVLASAVGDQATATGIANVLDSYPGSSYLRTDQTCTSLTQDIDGAPIYVVFFGPFPFASDACAARADGSPDAYARQLSNDVGSSHSVGCA